jgi:hypothetical protein
MRRLVLTSLFLVAGCQDYLFNQVCPEAIRESSIERAALTPTPADILFVVDNSGSMADEQMNLGANFDRFINQIAGNGDYHIGVVSTDQLSMGGEREGLQNFVFSDQYPNVLTNFSNSACTEIPIAHGCFRGPDPSRRIIDSNTMDSATQISVFNQNVNIGSCGTGTEQGLKSMISALNQANGCNTGFLRRDANLVVVLVSDEQDADDTPIQQYVEQLKAIKEGAAKIRVAAIVGYWDSRASDCSIGQGNNCGSVCSNPPPQGSHTPCARTADCSGSEVCLNTQCENPDLQYFDSCRSCSFYNAPDCCSAVAGGRYVDFALAMEAEVVRADSSVIANDCKGGERPACRIDTICQANFGDTLAAIARDLLPVGTYNLVPPASNPAGVTVVVKGGRFPDGKNLLNCEAPGADPNECDFEISEDGSVLNVKGEDAPQEGETISINFVVDSENRAEAPRGACQVTN